MVDTGLRCLRDADQVLDWLRQFPARDLVVDSRQVGQGDVFVAWSGKSHDARRHALQALAQGACACLVQAEGLESSGLDDERIAAVPDIKRVLGDLSAAFYGDPSREMEVVAVTGTNGKTSSAWWIAQASALLGCRSGVMGTLGMGEPALGPNQPGWRQSALTTPDAATLQAGLRAFARDGVRRCALEASSIGIAEHRLDGTRIRTAVFTNFTQDHLDYHGDLQAYWAAKRQLFDWPSLRAAVVNLDDPQGLRLAQELGQRRPGLDLWTVGFTPDCRIRAGGLTSTAAGTRLELCETGQADVTVEVPFLGRYNAANLLGVIGALRALGHAWPEILAVLPQLGAVPGRMQALGGLGEPLAVVDYAHTPDALEKALQTLRPLAQARQGRLWCVFGCGGDRDRGKRPLMGRAASRWADRVVLTSDNPRSEEPGAILADIRAGVPAEAPRPVEQADRAKAIALALEQAQCRDVVLVAGKGHESHQEVRGIRHPCRDDELVAQALAQRSARGFFTLGDAHDMLAPRARLHGDPDIVLARLSSDTRGLAPGDLYVALRGERFDGNDFVAQAHAAGAAAVITERSLEGTPTAGLTVPDSLVALQDLARGWRRQLALPVVAVAGSNGKTTVTQMVASIFRAWLGPAASHTQGNLNNHIGVPLSVLSLRAGASHGHRAAVLELGMNHPGEIARLAAIAQPTVALVNNAQREHQEFMHSVEAVARENGAVLQALPTDGTAVFPAQDPHAGIWQEMAGSARVWRFAVEVVPGDAAMPSTAEGAESTDRPALQGPEVRAWGQWHDGAWQMALISPKGGLTAQVCLPGRHNLHNAVAAAAAALAAGAPLNAVTRGLSEFRAVPGRSVLLAITRHGESARLIDDTYNANPDSVRAGIDVLAEMPGPRALILGDMGEVGAQGPAFHAEVGHYARQRGIDCLWALGDLCENTAREFGAGARHFQSMEALIAALPELPSARSILIKGSRFMRMERVVDCLKPTRAGAC